MKRVLFASAALLTAALLPVGASAQETIKIGVINSYSGQFADTGAQIDNGIKLYMKQHGDTVAGKKIEIIRKDTGGPNPDVAKRLAQELDRARQGRHSCRLHADSGSAWCGRRGHRGQKIHGRDECRDFGRHRKIAVHRARVADAAADRRNARHLGGHEGQGQEGLYHGHRLRPGHRCRTGLPARVQGGGRRNRRLGAHADRQSGLLGLRAARERPQPGIDLRIRSRAARNPARSARPLPSARWIPRRSRS